jgi:hypothetical protein
MVGLWSPIVCEDGIAVIGATVQILFMLEDSSDDLSSFRRKIMLNIAKLDIKNSPTIFQRSKFNVESVNFVIGSTDNHSCHGHRMSRNEANAARLILRPIKVRALITNSLFLVKGSSCFNTTNLCTMTNPFPF